MQGGIVNEDVKAMVEAIDLAVENDQYDLNEWEDEFLKTIRRYLAEGIPLSEKQDACLEKIWEKAV